MRNLREILDQEDTVIFVGSGVSRWSGLPNWRGFIEALADFIENAGGRADLVRAEVEKGELLQAASYGFDKLTKEQVGKFIREVCLYGRATPHEIHRKIVTLGSRCFVTTNYDDLLEQSVRKWLPELFFKPAITNRHLTETAEIIHARSIDFIFKPHGDAGDIDSIILTREQYRQLLPNGERQAALESLKTLLVTRPVIYLGFGLRDPDFMYVRDLLANIYKGGVRDHYAVIADITDEEIDYWRRNYGIHLIRYNTTVRADGKADHTNLLELLDRLAKVQKVSDKALALDVKNPAVLLALTRYASGVARVPRLATEFQVRVRSEEKKKNNLSLYMKRDAFDRLPVQKFLKAGPRRAILIGLPGAGKTYALRVATANLAETLQKACLADNMERSVAIPLYLDLKVYRGDLIKQVAESFPPNISLDEIERYDLSLMIFIDSFNEMPREYRENGIYESDFEKFLKMFHKSSIIISSRTIDGLEKLEFPVYNLDYIDEFVLDKALKGIGVRVSGRFEGDVKGLLQRPFYLNLILQQKMALSAEAHPRDLFESFFNHINSQFEARFGRRFDLTRHLALCAFSALSRGEEAFPVNELLKPLKIGLESQKLSEFAALDIANWLVSVHVLIPSVHGRISFVHQSITEYLASLELTRQYQTNNRVFDNVFATRRWDQALFLSLSLIPAYESEEILARLFSQDAQFTLRAIKYVESGRDTIVQKMLKLILRDSEIFSGKWDVCHALECDLPIAKVHEPQLWALVDLGDALGAAAAIQIVNLEKVHAKERLLDTLFSKPDDYNLCANGIGVALKPFITEDDVEKLAGWADVLQDRFEGGDDFTGFKSGVATLLDDIDIYYTKDIFLKHEINLRHKTLKIEILCEILQNLKSNSALRMAADLLLEGVKSAVISVYFICKFSFQELEYNYFNGDHVKRMLETIFDGETWSFEALSLVCSKRSDLAELVTNEASKEHGLARALLLYCTDRSNEEIIFDALEGLVTSGVGFNESFPLELNELNWEGKERLFTELVQLRNARLAALIHRGL